MSSASRAWPIVLDAGSDRDRDILKEYAEFWKIPYQTSDKVKTTTTRFASGNSLQSALSDGAVIVTPNGRDGAARIAQENNFQLSSGDATISLPIGPDTSVSMKCETHTFSGSEVEPIPYSANTPILFKKRGTRLYVLAVDLLAEYSKRVYDGVEDLPSWKFRLASRLPFSYQSIPRFIRDRAFRSPEGLDGIREDNLGPVECLRTLFLASIVKASGPIPRVRFWKRGKSYALAVTHDVETLEGLEKGVPQLLEVERELGIPSSWNLPSDRYPLTPVSVSNLKDAVEIGGHDTKHDGRLIFESEGAKIKRLRQCKETLEKLTGRAVVGFRAPLLQHSSELVSAEAKAGYLYDSSCPSWEILSPTSMHSHGVGTIFPFEKKGIVEIPVSLPQDHQLIRVAQQTPTATVDLWLKLSRWMKTLGGPCILLIHPDYELATPESRTEYQRLLQNFSNDPECDIMTMAQLSEWWRKRESVYWDLTGETPRLAASNSSNANADLVSELVTDYGSRGFTTVTSN